MNGHLKVKGKTLMAGLDWLPIDTFSQVIVREDALRILPLGIKSSPRKRRAMTGTFTSAGLGFSISLGGRTQKA